MTPMFYNPKIHNRQSRRLKGYDYSRPGLYFITIVCQNRIRRFGHVKNGEMILYDNGLIAHEEWARLSERFPNIEIDTYQIMPDHMHGIIKIVGAAFVAQDAQFATGKISPQAEVNPAPTISAIIGAYKSLVANACLKIYKSNNKIMGKFWQRNYYEHIIRNPVAYNNISRYIVNNPKEWKLS